MTTEGRRECVRREDALLSGKSPRDKGALPVNYPSRKMDGMILSSDCAVGQWRRSMLKRREVVHLTAAALVLGIATMIGPVGAQDSGQTDTQRLAIRGYDPVGYFTEGRPLLGKPDFAHLWARVRYRFAPTHHITLVRTDPDRFAPQFAGSCAMAMSKGMKVEADPENWLISNGRLFVFRSSDAVARFQADTQGTAAAADKNWDRLKS